MQAWIDRDVARCDALLARDFRLRSVATDTVVDRDEWLRQVESGRVIGTSFDYEEMDIRVVGATRARRSGAAAR